MKKIFTLLLLLSGFSALAQQYNNEWIRYNQTYYKFKVRTEGIYRIPQSVLVNAGLGSTSVEFFELWKNGKQVPFYSSVATGQLPTNGYIEFWGEPNNGEADKELYREPEYQQTDHRSLFTDTAVYFLSVNTSQSGFKYNDPGNDIASNTRAAEPFFMHKTGTYFNSRLNPGYAVVVGEYIYSSSFDKGEFWSSPQISPNTLYSAAAHTNLFVYASGPASSLKFGAMGGALNSRTVKVRVNNTVVVDTVMDFFNDMQTTIPVSTSLISTNTASVQFQNMSTVTSDRMVLSHYELKYPRQFNFGNLKNFVFELSSNNDARYLEISNFNYGSVPPVLYDITNGRRITGAISSPSIIKFVVPASGTNSKLVLVNQEDANINTIASLTPKIFTQFSNVANQGDYIIITHPFLYSGTRGNNPIEDYKNYRQSNDGGNYSVAIIDINELADQFAFGIKKHPSSIKNFLRFARAQFSVPLKFAFLMGRGVSYTEYFSRQGEGISENLNLIPSFGYPPSDNMLSSANSSSPIAVTPIGRLSVVNGKEIEDYTEKVIEYETAQRNSPNTVEGRKWMKNVVHVTGASDPYLGTVLCNYMNVYRQLIEDTLFGGTVSTFCKTSANPVEQLSTGKIEQLFKEGISFLTYFGHSGATTLEFNLDNPQSYNNEGKYPVFFVNGCNAGNFFTYTPQRLLVNETLSEKFVLAKQRGSIAFVASTHFGIVNYLNLYLNNLYGIIGKTDFGKSLGEINRDALQNVMNVFGPSDFYSRMHAEQITLHGDPAVSLNTASKPDYVIEEPQIEINPAFISIAEDHFQLKVKMYNLGKAVTDSITIEIKRQLENGASDILFVQKISPIRFMDSLNLKIPIVATRDIGLNKITVTLDVGNNIDEVAESNNSATKEFFIFEDEARPVYPNNYSIITNDQQKLYASTADPFSEAKEYKMELDTTDLFNSPLKISRTIRSSGGLLEFDPSLIYKDSTVYYWRIASVQPANEDYRWNHSSFMYKSGDIKGYNQSHLFQHKKSDYNRLDFDSTSGKLSYGERVTNLFIRNGVFPTAANQAGDFTISVDGSSDNLSVCGVSGIIFSVFDPLTFKPWLNALTGSSQYGSDVVCGNTRRFNFQYNILDSVKRRKAIEFLDLIPEGHFVVVRNISGNAPSSNTYAADWMNDTLRLGENNSLYHRLLFQGFTNIDSFYRPRAFIFVYKKNKQLEYIPKSIFSESINDRINLTTDCVSPDTLGYITSPVFGPAKAWNEVLWDGYELESTLKDNPTVEIIGMSSNQQETTLYTLDKNTRNFDISAIDASTYPYMRLRMRNIDSINLTPFQLSYWRVHYDPVAEGALAPNLYFLSKDTLEIGEPLKFGIAFKNISKVDFDSLAMKATILDKNNVPRNIVLPRQKPLQIGDTLYFNFEFETIDLAEKNTLFIDFNPDNDQHEQHHFNNFLYRDFYVKPDYVNPLLDVTFDGLHILNRDIVSSKPHIQIKLKDEAKFMLLNDTALSSVQVKFPDGTMRTYQFDNDTLRFTPATVGGDNTASIDFNPVFSKQFKPEGDEYELIVKGKDRSGNKAGEVEYRVSFKVFTRPMISNLLNYPNPFTTSTAFVFTITGSELPQNIKIQVLTVTGKIVREITKDELGQLRIGRNITDFKWDGTDQFGQRLANGVYLYRVVTTLNGKRMEKFKATDDNTDQFFNNGYGKMYLMR